jgi:hypothetical protein
MYRRLGLCRIGAGSRVRVGAGASVFHLMLMAVRAEVATQWHRMRVTKIVSQGTGARGAKARGAPWTLHPA